MIHTAKQLKDKVKNMSGGNSEVLSYNLETLLAEKMQTYKNNDTSMILYVK